MANYYCRSTDGSNADNGSTWALAKADLHTATTGALATASGAGDTIYVSQAHSQSTAASIILSPLGTAANPTKIIGVSDAAEPPTTLTFPASAVIATGAGAYGIDITGYGYWEGISFRSGVDSSSTVAPLRLSNASTPNANTFVSCKFETASVGANNRIQLGSTGSGSNDDTQVILIDPVFKFGATSHAIAPAASRVRWKGGSIDSSGSIPATLFVPASGSGVSVDMEINGADLSAITGTLVAQGVAATGQIIFKNCKLGSGVTLSSGTPNGPGGIQLYFYNCDSADTNYMYAYRGFLGDIDTVTGQYLSGGSTIDSQALALKAVSSASMLFHQALKIPISPIYIDTVGSSKTVTVEVAQDNGAAALTESEIWLEVEYLGTSGYPISSVATDHNSTILSLSTTAQTTSTATWTGLTNPTKQKLEVTFTPQEKGYIQCRVYLAKPSATVYVDPLPVVS